MKTSESAGKPLDYIAGLRQNWKTDLLSGFIVFLIALPLCLGIAMASGVPPISGIISAIVGGLLVSMLGGSHVAINGPAAGLIVVILGTIESLGAGNTMAGYTAMLAAVVVSGALLAIMGLFKAGRLGDFFPSAAVHGMLAAIGVIIIAKQVHTMLGVAPEAKNPLALLGEIPLSLINANPDIAVIGGVSLLILIGLPLIKNRYIKRIPAPMVVILVSIPLGMYFDLEHEHIYLFAHHEYHLGPNYLVNLPGNMLDGLTFPDFSRMGELAFWGAVLTITLVQGLESLLSATAVERLDPYKRKVNLNRDLTAVGGATVVSGLLGGLPMIAEIVRSSANINNGARTRWSNFFHAGFLLFFVALLPGLIHQIPLAALAAMLVYTGYRLASPKVFVETFHTGREQLAIFLITLLVTLATDLIIGIASGIAAEWLMNLANGAPLGSMFRAAVVRQTDEASKTATLTVQKAAVFSNFLGLKKHLSDIPKNYAIVVDLSKTKVVDHSVMEHLHHIKRDYELGGTSFTIKGLDNLSPTGSHPMAMHKTGVGNLLARFSRRQLELMVLSAQKHWEYTPQQFNDLDTWQGLNVLYGRALERADNRIRPAQWPANVCFADLQLREGEQLANQYTAMTVVRITGMDTPPPVFQLRPEGRIDRLMDTFATKQDVDFDTHPHFSKLYHLTGPDVLAIRRWFHSGLLAFFEAHPGIYAESNGEALFLYPGAAVLPVEDVPDWMEMAQQLAHITQPASLVAH